MNYSTFLIALDGSPDSLFACETAGTLGPDSNNRIFHLLYCASPVASLVGGETRDKLHKKREETAEEIFAVACATLSSFGTCHRHFVEGAPAEEIVRVAKENKCDAIVMGTRGHSRLETFVLGSVSQAVLRHSTVPVLLANTTRVKS